MEHMISFPHFGWEFTIQRSAFTVFGMPIYWYGIIICIGFILGALYINSRVKEFGLTTDNLLDCLLICVPLAIIFARAYFVIFQWEDYKENLIEIFAVRNGGLAIYGGVIGAVLGLFIYSRMKKLSFVSMCDLAGFGLLTGQSVGRWGNFVNAEAHGGPTSLPWGMSINGDAPVHPTFFYESAWNLIGFLLLHFYSKKRKFKGEIALLYVAWYGLGRTWIEGLRTDSLYIGGFRVSQMLALISCVVAIAAWGMMCHRTGGKKKIYADGGTSDLEPRNQMAEEQSEPLPESESMPLPEQAPSLPKNPKPIPEEDPKK